MNFCTLFTFLLLNLLSLLPFSWMTARKLCYELNGNCGQKCNSPQDESAVNVLHIKSIGDNDTIHTIFATLPTVAPTLLMVKTKPNCELEIDWHRLLSNQSNISNAIRFTDEPFNAIGLEISKLYFFNDINKTGNYSKGDPTLNIDWNNFIWKTVNNSINEDNDSIKAVFSENKGYEFYNGSISFQIRVDANDGRTEELPHLAFTQLSSWLEITVNNVTTESAPYFSEPDRARLMAHISVVTYGNNKSSNYFDTLISIDDEYTPGVFERVILNLNSNNKNADKSGFLQWKPIAYSSEERIIANSIDVIHSNVQSNITLLNTSKILLAFFDNDLYNSANFSYTFGALDDTNYYVDDKKYSVFSLVVGLDQPPEHSLSFLVKMIILTGFGLPLLVMVISAVYLIVRKIRKRNYDDLLLSQENTNN